MSRRHGVSGVVDTEESDRGDGGGGERGLEPSRPPPPPPPMTFPRGDNGRRLIATVICRRRTLASDGNFAVRGSDSWRRRCQRASLLSCDNKRDASDNRALPSPRTQQLPPEQVCTIRNGSVFVLMVNDMVINVHESGTITGIYNPDFLSAVISFNKN